MADNPADQETMRRSAAFFAEAIDIHRDHLRSEDVEIYARRHSGLDKEMSGGSAQITERFYWLEKDLKSYSDADEISDDDKQRILNSTERLIDDALELSAARSEYAALGVLLNKGARKGARAADDILNDGDFFAKMDIPENLRDWFRDNILSQAVTADFKDRKKLNQATLEQVNSNIYTIERWTLAESEANLYRYDAQVKFYKKEKDISAIKEAEERYNDLGRKLQRQTRELFNDQVINGARSRGELLMLYKLGDKPTIGKPVAAASEPPPQEPVISAFNPAIPTSPEVTEPVKTESSQNNTPSGGEQSTAPATDAKTIAEPLKKENAGVVAEAEQKPDTRAEAKETAIEILDRLGRELNPNYDAAAARPALESFMQYFRLNIKPDQKISPDDKDELESLKLTAAVYKMAGGDAEKMKSPEVLELALFSNPSQVSPASETVPQNDSIAAAETARKEAAPSPLKAADLEAFAQMAKNLDYDAFAKQVSGEVSDEKLTAMRLLELLDEELNHGDYDHALAKQDMRRYLELSGKENPDEQLKPDDLISLGDHEKINALLGLAVVYRMAKGNPLTIASIYQAGEDSPERKILGDVGSSFKKALDKYYEDKNPKEENKDENDFSLNSWFDPDADINLLRVGVAAAGAYALKKFLKSRAAARAAVTPATTPTPVSTPSGAPTPTAATPHIGPVPANVVPGATTTVPPGAATQAAGTAPSPASTATQAAATSAATHTESPEMEALRRENLKLKEKDLKHREKMLDDLKFEHRKRKEEYAKLPEKRETDERLLDVLEESIEKKEKKIKKIKREIRDTERALAGKPRSQATEVTRQVETTTAKASVTGPAAAVVPDNNNGAATTERLVETVHPAPGNLAVAEPAVHSPNSADVETPATTPAGETAIAKLAEPPAPGTDGPAAAQATTEPNNHVPAADASSDTPKTVEPAKPKTPPLEALTNSLDEMKKRAARLDSTFEAGKPETMLDDRDIPRTRRPEPVKYAHDTKSLLDRGRALQNEASLLEIEKGLLEGEFREIEKKRAQLRVQSAGSHEKTPEHKKLESIEKKYSAFKDSYETKVETYKADIDDLGKELESHKQRGETLGAEKQRLKTAEQNLDKEFKILEKIKNTLTPEEHELHWRRLLEKRVNLHAEGMSHAEQHAIHNGAGFSLLSDRPTQIIKPGEAARFSDVKLMRGIGIGLGGLSLYGRTMTDAGRQDFKDQFGTAATGAAADVTAIGADAAEIRQATRISHATQVEKAAGNVRTLSAIEEGLETTAKVAGKVKTGSKLLTPVAVAATMVSSGADFEVGRRKGDAGRSAGATGAATGGLAGATGGALLGAKAGAVIGTFFVPGAGTLIGGTIGGIVGGVGGALGGGYIGEKVGRMALTSTFSRWFGIDDALIRASEGGVEIAVAKHYDLNKDGMLSLDEIKQGLEKNGFHSLSEIDTNRDGLTNEELRTALRRGLEGSAGLPTGQFSQAANPADVAPVSVGGGPRIDPLKK